MQSLKNFCIEPKTDACTCDTAECGGIVVFLSDCPEHGNSSVLAATMKSHRHPVRGLLVGSMIA